MNKNAKKPGRCSFRCSLCGKRGPEFVNEVRSVAVAHVRSMGWAVFEGETNCVECVGAELVGALAVSVVAVGKGRAA